MKRFIVGWLKRLGWFSVSGEDLGRAARIAALSGLASFVLPAVAVAQAVNIDLGTGAGLTDRVIQLAGLLTILSLAPSIVIMTTAFVRIVVVLSLLRTALGLQQSPPNSVLISLSLFLTAIVMAPTLTASYNAGVKPLLDKKMELPQAFAASTLPVKQFMLAQVEQDDLALFVRLSHTPKVAQAVDLPIQVVTSGFMISELERFFSRLGPEESGPIDHYYGCGDSLVRRGALPDPDRPFSAIRNHIGGEDDLLFGAMQRVGARFAWAAEAWVWEDPAPERLTLRYTALRAFAYGQGASAHCAAAGDRLGVARWMVLGVAQALAFGAYAGVKWLLRTPSFAFSLDRAARGLGKTLWWKPFKIRFYGLTAPAVAQAAS